MAKNSPVQIRVIIPALNEQGSIGKVVQHLPAQHIQQVIVVNNGSTDDTAAVAAQAGATVLDQPQPGYGNACLKGMDYLAQLPPNSTDIVVFIDGDFSDHPEELPQVVAPILDGQADMVIGSRALGQRQRGSMTMPQVFGNWLATRLLKLLYNVSFTDLGPFRAIRYDKLLALGMKDQNYGWTVEMQLKAARQKLRCTEVPVTYRKRIGTSKVSGTVKGTVMAGYKILYTIFKYL